MKRRVIYVQHVKPGQTPAMRRRGWTSTDTLEGTHHADHSALMQAPQHVVEEHERIRQKRAARGQ